MTKRGVSEAWDADEAGPASGRVETTGREEATVLCLSDGATATRRGDALLLCDAEGRLLVRYAGGSAEIHAATGDLTLAAPRGQVVIRSGADVAIEAARDITQKAARRVEIGAGEERAQLAVEPGATTLKTKRLHVDAGASSVVAGQISVVAAQIVTTATRVAHRVERWELTATRLVERSRDAFRDVADLAQTRIGRARTLVKGLYALDTKRTVLTSKDDTKVDGKKVLLG